MKKVYRKETKFPDIKENPSLLGFGCMRFPKIDSEKPDIDEEQAEEMIDYAYKHGVNYFDTAYPYHQGLSETFIGKVLKKYPRESFYLANKMPGWELETVEDAKRIFSEQLEKCQVDYFDFYLCHALSEKNFEIYKKELKL
ncbi:MAG: aldo/keto reductase, partial [Bacillota bacterium]